MPPRRNGIEHGRAHSNRLLPEARSARFPMSTEALKAFHASYTVTP